MSVLRPRPPTDPIEHVAPPGVLSAEGCADPHWQAWLDRAEEVRGTVAALAGSANEEMLRAYGTTRSHARRRDSALFAILDAARQIRESVDRVVVIGDRADRALVDLLVSTCCHPCHDDLPRHERGGRPRVRTIGPDDDDDTVQGVLDTLATPGGDRLLDAWGVVPVGPCREAFTQACISLFAAATGPAAWPGKAPAIVVTPPGHIPLSLPAASGNVPISLPTAQDGDGVFAAGLLPAAIAGIDVVRLLEGAAAMARRFREAPAGANPACSLAIVGRWLAAGSPFPDRLPRRRLLPPARWKGIEEWLDQWESFPAPSAVVEGWFTTPIAVAECRRDPFAAAPVLSRPLPLPPSADRLLLPRCDEHTLGQLLEALRLAAAVEACLA